MRLSETQARFRIARRQFIHALAASLCAPLAGCAPPAQPLRVGGCLWAGYEPLFMARDLGLIDSRSIRLAELPAASDSLRALAISNLEAACLTLDEVLSACAEGIDMRVVLVMDFSLGADMVLARPGIREVADLAGKRLGVEQTAVGALMFASLVQGGGIDPARIERVPLTIDRIESAWQRGEVDAVVCFEPVAGRLLAAGAVNLFDSRMIPERIIDVLALRHPLAEEHILPLRQLIQAWFAALRHLQQHPVDAAYRMSGRLGIAPDAVTRSFAGMRLPDLPDNRRLLLGERPALIDALTHLSGVMPEAGLLSAPVELAGLIDGSHLPRPAR